MSAVQFHCPLCRGLFQVDDSLAGIEVNCPHCAGLVTVPSFDAEPPPPQGDLFQLSCPICAGEFQVPPEAAGQEVSCPHCYGVVAVPALSDYGDSAAPPVPSDQPATTNSPRHVPGSAGSSPAPVQQMYYPPGAAPNSPVADGSSSTRRRLDPPDSTPSADLLPPGAADAASTQERKPLPAAIPQRRNNTVLIPTEQGLVGVHEPVKTIQLRGEEVELRQLTSQEKAQRRMIRNGLLFAFCVIALIAVMAALKVWG